VSIGVGGALFQTVAEFTEQEASDAKDLSALKEARLRDALTGLHDQVMMALHG
jgi:hypothetical protein